MTSFVVYVVFMEGEDVLITVAVVKKGGVDGCFMYAVKWWLPEQLLE